MSFFRQRLASTVVLFTLATTVGFSGSSSPLEDPSAPVAPARQFDFWLGEWELTWPGEQSGLPAGQVGRGTNKVTAILDRAVIQEEFADSAPKSLRGMSVSVFDKPSGKWKQTWVDNQGGYLEFTGELKDGEMILSRPAAGPSDKMGVQRMVFHDIAKDELDWRWESSQDGGKTWKVNWQIHYQRKK